MKNIIIALIQGFTCEQGLPEGIYNAVRELIFNEWGYSAAQLFATAVDATDGAFYIPDKYNIEDLIAQIESLQR